MVKEEEITSRKKVSREDADMPSFIASSLSVIVLSIYMAILGPMISSVSRIEGSYEGYNVSILHKDDLCRVMTITDKPRSLYFKEEGIYRPSPLPDSLHNPNYDFLTVWDTDGDGRFDKINTNEVKEGSKLRQYSDFDKLQEICGQVVSATYDGY